MSDVRYAAPVSACDSPWLLRIRETLHVQGERYRRFSVSTKEITRDLSHKHQDIMDAALDRNAKRATQVMTKYFAPTTKLLLTQARLVVSAWGAG